MLKRGHERIHFREILLNVFHQKRLLMILLVSIFVCIIAVIIYFSFFSLQRNICGDGTFYGECSERKPYFCEQGILVERASICGCFENLTINEDSCISKYQKNPKNIILNYVLRGEERNLSFVVYGGAAEYFFKLSKRIVYKDGEEPSRKDFKLMDINEEEQRYLILPLVTEIQNLADNEKDQVRIGVSIVQNIPFGSSDRKTSFGNNLIDYSRYSYEVLYDEEGVCGEKAALLAFMLREMGYGVAFFYYVPENHEVVAVKCPKRNSVGRTGYCFIEPSGPAIMTDKNLEYFGIGKLSSEPELIVVSEGDSIGNWWYEYRDARKLGRLRRGIGIFKEKGLNNLIEKYGLEDIYSV